MLGMPNTATALAFDDPDIQRQPARGHGLKAQVDQPGIMAAVGVRQQQAGQGRTRRPSLHIMQLLAEVGRGVDHKGRARRLVRQAQRAHPAPQARIGPGRLASRAATAGLRHPAILCGSEKDSL